MNSRRRCNKKARDFTDYLTQKYTPLSTPLCKSRPAFFNFRGLAPASLSRQPQPAKPAIFGKNGGKTINLVGTFLHNGVQTNIGYTENQFEEVQ